MRTSFVIDNVELNIRGSTGSLIVGKPGSGKSVLTSLMALQLMKVGALSFFIDNKKSDFYSLNTILGSSRVVSTPGQTAKILRILTDFMDKRYETHQSDWVDYNLRPIVVIFDEFSATLTEADKATANEIIKYLKQIIFKARQMGGIYLILASQRLTADVLERNISSEFSTRIGMQNLDRVSLNLAFPGCNLDEIPVIENIPGHGLMYDDHFDTMIPQPFVAPDMSNVDVPLVVKKLDERNKFNNFAKESYWPWK